MITKIFCDGGVIGHNPSKIGGTYAFRLLDETGQIVKEASGVILPQEMFISPDVSNNQTEMLALLYALRSVADICDDFAGTVYSDSQVTLGRVFLGWKWTNIPEWMHRIYRGSHERLENWNEIKFVLLDGHPTKAQLAAGIGKRGHPVSEHNVWCDLACQAVARKFYQPVSEMATDPSLTPEQEM